MAHGGEQLWNSCRIDVLVRGFEKFRVFEYFDFCGYLEQSLVKQPL
jgi:hypothetical protein